MIVDVNKNINYSIHNDNYVIKFILNESEYQQSILNYMYIPNNVKYIISYSIKNVC
jgi:hypothetical protein